MKKIVMSLAICSSLVLGASNDELAKELELLKLQIKEMQSSQEATNESILDEISNVTGTSTAKYESYSSLGEGASKVYHTNNEVSIGGYGEYRYKKYSGYKNTTSDIYNNNLNKGEFNIVRFVPYIGFKFNDWIVMNTEIEFEDGGARSDDTKNYKYAIVEFSYIDFLISDSFALRIGHILTPMGLINLNHEPTSFLTTDRPAVETYIIPSTWHTNGILAHGKVDDLEYYAGVITSPDSDHFGDAESRFIQQGRLGARQFTDSFSFVARVTYNVGDGLNVGGSAMFGQSEGSESGVDTTVSMAEIHASYKNHGFDIQALATFGELGGDVSELSTEDDVSIAQSVNGQYITVGYDLLSMLKFNHKGYLFGEVERLDMDANSDTQYVDNNRFFEYTVGFSYFPDPKVVLKTDYKLRDYGSNAKLEDEKSFNFGVGFIF